MTTTLTAAYHGPITASGTTPIPFDDFQAISADEISVILDGEVVDSGDYTVVVNGDGSGTVTPLVDLDGEVYIVSAPNYRQLADFERFAPYFPDQLNAHLDRLARYCIALKGETSRAVLAAIGDEGIVLPEGAAAALLAGIENNFAGPTGPEGPAGSAVIAGIAWKTPQQYGAVADGLTDDSDAIDALIDSLPNYGGMVWFPAGKYLITRRHTWGKNVRIMGDTAGKDKTFVYQESQVVDGAWEYYAGAVIVCDTDTAGFLFPSFTDAELSPSALNAVKGATGTTAYWQYPGAYNSHVDGLVFYSKGGTDADAHGVEIRAFMTMHNVICVSFPGSGFKINATAGADWVGAVYGNANHTVLDACVALRNDWHGFHIVGADANACRFASCNAQLNGAWGFYDDSYLGNHYDTCHCNSNNRLLRASATAGEGSFKHTQNSGRTLYSGCYSEEGNGTAHELTASCSVLGGTLSSAPATVASRGLAFVFGKGIAQEGFFTHINSKRYLTTGGTEPRVAAQLGGNDTLDVLSFGSSDTGADLFTGGRDIVLRYNPTVKIYSLRPPSSTGYGVFQIPHFQTPTARRLAPALPQGYFNGNYDTGLGGFVGETSATSVATMPVGVYARGDRFYFAAPSAGGRMGVICTTAGVKANAWLTGTTTYATHATAALASYVENGGNVYRLTAKGATAAAANAPVHGSGAVTGADDHEWTFQNANTVPVLKLFGSIDA